MRHLVFLLLALIVTDRCNSQSKELPLIPDKQGTFEIISRSDYAGSGCSFTVSEIAGNLAHINELVTIVRRNQVVSEMKGFDGRARIYSTLACQQGGHYGVPSRISFEFASWFRMKDGTEKRILVEPPEWSVYLNTIQPFWTNMVSTEPEFISVPEKKQTIAPGIDVYDDECFVLYDPNRPAYWLPVTVKEAFDAAYENLRKSSDEIQWGYMKKMLDEERAAFQPGDWDKQATHSGMLSRVGIRPGFPKIMKVNPAYWDKTRPRSDLQIITFRMITNKKYLTQRTQEYLNNNSISYNCARFEESLDIEFVKSLMSLIHK